MSTSENRSRRTVPARLLAVLVALVVLAPVAASALPIEGFPHYQPQTTCSPKAKPGTLKLAAWLLKTYPGSGSLGISRSCKDGGVSEHKEGRAFDWELSVHSARDRGYAQAFLTRAFATDRAGNADALARRMGIMYIIWNDHIYSATYHFQKRAYLNSSCTKLATCGDTLRHRNHMHISLTRAGGAGRTSWYTGKVAATPQPTPTPTTPKPSPAPTPKAPKPSPKPTPKPAPKQAPKPAPKPQPRHDDGVLDLSRQPYVATAVPTDGTPRVTRYKVKGGRSYHLTAAGLFTYGSPRQVADAACVWSPSTSAWVPSPPRRTVRRQGSMDLLVNGARVFGTECHANHVYRATVTPRSTRTLSLRVANRGEGRGRMVLTVARWGTDLSRVLPTYPALRPAPMKVADVQRGYGLTAETVSVPADGTGVLTSTELQAGAQYRLTVSGTAGLGGGVATDGDCIEVDGAWYRQASLDPRHPDQDHGQLYVDGAPFVAGSGSCDSHTHTATVTAAADGRMTFALWDPVDPTDDSGAVTVTVQRLTAVTAPGVGGTETPRTRSYPWTQDHDWLQVSSSSATGALSTMRLRTGEHVQVIVRGTQRSGSTVADASCVQTSAGWAQRDPGLALDQDLLDLWVDGQDVQWRSLGRSGTCSDDQHAYTAWVTATHNGPLRLAVLDLDYRDNRGSFDVTLLRG